MMSWHFDYFEMGSDCHPIIKTASVICLKYFAPWKEWHFTNDVILFVGGVKDFITALHMQYKKRAYKYLMMWHHKWTNTVFSWLWFTKRDVDESLFDHQKLKRTWFLDVAVVEVIFVAVDWSVLASSKWTPSFMIEGFDFLAIPTKGFLRKTVSISYNISEMQSCFKTTTIFILFKNRF